MMNREQYPEEVWAAIQRHPSGRFLYRKPGLDAAMDGTGYSIVDIDADATEASVTYE